MDRETWHAMSWSQQRRTFIAGYARLHVDLYDALRTPELSYPPFDCLMVYLHTSVNKTLIERILNAGYEPVSIEEISNHLSGKTVFSPGKRRVHFSWDDAHESVLSELDNYLPTLNTARLRKGLALVRPSVAVILGFGKPTTYGLDMRTIEPTTRSFIDGGEPRHVTKGSVDYHIQKDLMDFLPHGLIHEQISRLLSPQRLFVFEESLSRLKQLYINNGHTLNHPMYVYPVGLPQGTPNRQSIFDQLHALGYEAALGTRGNLTTLTHDESERYDLSRFADWYIQTNKAAQEIIFPTTQREQTSTQLLTIGDPAYVGFLP